MSFWVKEKSFYQKMAAIAIPLALQNLINVGVSLLDTVMLGQLGEVAMSGSSLGNQIGFIYQIMNLGADRRGRGTDQPILGAEGSGFHPQGHEYGL